MCCVRRDSDAVAGSGTDSVQAYSSLLGRQWAFRIAAGASPPVNPRDALSGTRVETREERRAVFGRGERGTTVLHALQYEVSSQV